ncbi:hypothetical protein JOF59_006687 [Streptomyces clavifer]|uniref:Uncharacterized protein n=1 Tax=Streptomyces clavifer TaxID=68188 RepID=A0ABS4VJX1_9ACTN|nr:hypothetical protein [Streptomyces clavifer]
MRRISGPGTCLHQAVLGAPANCRTALHGHG